MRFDLHGADGQIVGSFDSRPVALRIAHELLAEGSPHLLLKTFDDQGRLIAEALVHRRRTNQSTNR